MSILNFLLVFSFGIFVNLGTPEYGHNDVQCDLDASVNINKIDNSYLVEVDVKNSSGDFKYFFFNADTQLLVNTENSKTNSITLSKKGQYLCLVKDIQDNSCFTKIEFVI